MSFARPLRYENGDGNFAQFLQPANALAALDAQFDGRPSANGLSSAEGVVFLGVRSNRPEDGPTTDAAMILWPGPEQPPANCAHLGIEPYEGYVSFVVVAERRRGEGLGGKLLALAEKIATATGSRRLRAHVRPENAASRRMFEKAGWREAGLSLSGERIILLRDLNLFAEV